MVVAWQEEAGKDEGAKPKGKISTAAQAGWGVLKGAGERAKVALPVSIAFGAYDVFSAPEGQKMEAGMKVAGNVMGGWAGAEAGAAMGAAFGSLVPGIGTAVGGLLGGIVGGIAGTALANSLTDSLNNWIKGNSGGSFGGVASRYNPVSHDSEYKSAPKPLYGGPGNYGAPAPRNGPTINQTQHNTFHISSTEPKSVAESVFHKLGGNNDSRAGFIRTNF